MFLVTTLTSAASAATTQIIKDPLSVKDLLAQNLPKATNFYISYFLLQGLSLSSMALVQIASALVFKFVTTFFAYSPRRLFQKWAQLVTLSWGNVFPVFTNMGVIGRHISSASLDYSNSIKISIDLLLHCAINFGLCLYWALSCLPGLPIQLFLRLQY